MFTEGHQPANYGKLTTTRVLKDTQKVEEIKLMLKSKPRDYALFVFSINSGFRASDTLSIRREEIQREDGRLVIFKKERKTGKLRRVVLSQPVSDAIQHWLNVSDGEYLFEGQRGKMTVAYFGRMVKDWCAAVGLAEGTYATHSLRKAFVRLRLEQGVELHVLQWMLNHQNPQATLVYAGLLPNDAQAAYDVVV